MSPLSNPGDRAHSLRTVGPLGSEGARRPTRIQRKGRNIFFEINRPDFRARLPGDEIDTLAAGDAARAFLAGLARGKQQSGANSIESMHNIEIAHSAVVRAGYYCP